MREIKYRAWHKKMRSMDKVMMFNDKFRLIGIYNLGDFHLDEVEVMQYTGFKDKNGVELYEGDIVELKYHRDRRYKVKAKVEYGKWEGSFILKYEDNLTTEEYPLYKITANNYLEVIGNIYENKELLK